MGFVQPLRSIARATLKRRGIRLKADEATIVNAICAQFFDGNSPIFRHYDRNDRIVPGVIWNWRERRPYHFTDVARDMQKEGSSFLRGLNRQVSDFEYHNYKNYRAYGQSPVDDMVGSAEKFGKTHEEIFDYVLRHVRGRGETEEEIEERVWKPIWRGDLSNVKRAFGSPSETTINAETTLALGCFTHDCFSYSLITHELLGSLGIESKVVQWKGHNQQGEGVGHHVIAYETAEGTRWEDPKYLFNKKGALYFQGREQLIEPFRNGEMHHPLSDSVMWKTRKVLRPYS